MKRSKWIWLIWALILLCYAVPYTLLSDVGAWYGSFLFWSVAGLVGHRRESLYHQGFRGARQ